MAVLIRIFGTIPFSFSFSVLVCYEADLSMLAGFGSETVGGIVGNDTNPS